jgi:aminopeptidase N
MTSKLFKSIKLFKKFNSFSIFRIISPNQLRLVACTAIQNGGEAEWNFAYQKYKASEFAREKSALLSAMGCTREGYLLST